MIKRIILIVSINIFTLQFVFSQKIDTDSLLIKTLQTINIDKDYPKAIKMGRLGIKNAPNYLDFHIALGRTYLLTKEIDSSRYFFSYVIEQNPKYKEAFSYLAKLEIAEKNSLNAINTLDKAIGFYPEDKEFYFLKLEAIQLENNDEKTIDYLIFLQNKYPDNTDVLQELTILKTKSESNRIGVNYTITGFNREGVGPWNLIGLQYIRERKKFTIIGSVNYQERYSFDNKKSGVQYEVETFFPNTRKSYSYAGVAYSNDAVFPKLRLAYSYFQSFAKGWEGDLGLRYLKTSEKGLYTGVIGIGKYLGAYWIDFRTFLQLNEKKIYPAYTLTSRYYFNSRFDYVTAIAGYGTSPDERVTIGQFGQRLTYKSYRIGAGYNRLAWKNYIFGVLAFYNNQEYANNKFQNEYSLFLSLQYKF
jgi:YaiO family outer membrane protein